MKNYKKEELDNIMKDIIEYMGAKYPGLPFVFIIEASDAQVFNRSQSSHLCDPVHAVRALSQSINHIASQQIQAACAHLQFLQDRQVQQAMEESSTAVKN